MKLYKLKSEELVSITGGTEKDYDLGYAIGSHLRSGIETVGDVVNWLTTQIDNILPF